jgi:hypothetical protein
MPFGLFLTGPLSRHSTRELPFRPNEMASVAIRVALKVVSMFRLGFPEGAALGDFRDDFSGPKPGGFYVRDRVLCDTFLILAGLENRPAIAGPSIVAPTIHSRRIVNLKKEFQELPTTELLRIQNDLDRFGMRSVIAVRCIRNVTPCIADAGGNYPRVTAQQFLHTLEEPAGKKGSFSRHVTSSLLLRCLEQLSVSAVSLALELVDRNEAAKRN